MPGRVLSPGASRPPLATALRPALAPPRDHPAPPARIGPTAARDAVLAKRARDHPAHRDPRRQTRRFRSDVGRGRTGPAEEPAHRVGDTPPHEVVFRGPALLGRRACLERRDRRRASSRRTRGLLAPAAGHEVFLPQEQEPGMDAAGIFATDVGGIDWAAALVAIMDGPDPDSGTAWECGYAYGKKPIIPRPDGHPGTGRPEPLQRDADRVDDGSPGPARRLQAGSQPGGAAGARERGGEALTHLGHR